MILKKSFSLSGIIGDVQIILHSSSVMPLAKRVSVVTRGTFLVSVICCIMYLPADWIVCMIETNGTYFVYFFPFNITSIAFLYVFIPRLNWRIGYCLKLAVIGGCDHLFTFIILSGIHDIPPPHEEPNPNELLLSVIQQVTFSSLS